jgi:hypothetical protein
MMAPLVVSIIAAPSAVAAPACQPSSTSYFVGDDTYRSVAIYGASARIEYNNPNLCGDDGSDSTGLSMVWSMVTAYSANHPNNNDHHDEAWAQSGYGQAGPSSNYSNFPPQVWQFAQWTRECKVEGTSCGQSSPWITTIATTNPDPTVPWIYTSRWRTDTDSHIHMYANGVQLAETNYSPAGVWAGEWQARFRGETAEKESDVPGSAGDKTSMDLVRWVDGNQVFHLASLKPVYVSPNTRYHAANYSPSSGGTGINIWTDPF